MEKSKFSGFDTIWNLTKSHGNTLKKKISKLLIYLSVLTCMHIFMLIACVFREKTQMSKFCIIKKLVQKLACQHF